MSERAEWWGDVPMLSHVTPEMVIGAIAEAIGRRKQETWFQFSEVVGIDQMGPGGDPNSFVTRFYVGCVNPDAMDELDVMESVFMAIASHVDPAWDEYVYSLLPGSPAEGYVYRFVACGIERADAAFAPVEPREWRRVE